MRKEFEIELRRHKRADHAGVMEYIEAINVNNPKEFWRHIKNLGRQEKAIPWEVLFEDGRISFDKDVILDKWAQKLYNDIKGDFDEKFKEDIMQGDISPDDLVGVGNLNDVITVHEVRKVVEHNKRRKAVGIDKLPNEVFKNNAVIIVLLAFFHK